VSIGEIIIFFFFLFRHFEAAGKQDPTPYDHRGWQQKNFDNLFPFLSGGDKVSGFPL
jgi:hypothetical protein